MPLIFVPELLTQQLLMSPPFPLQPYLTLLPEPLIQPDNSDFTSQFHLTLSQPTSFPAILHFHQRHNYCKKQTASLFD
jgi:hypothetical protein